MLGKKEQKKDELHPALNKHIAPAGIKQLGNLIRQQKKLSLIEYDSDGNVVEEMDKFQKLKRIIDKNINVYTTGKRFKE